jgi:hypothetical protein
MRQDKQGQRRYCSQRHECSSKMFHGTHRFETVAAFAITASRCYHLSLAPFFWAVLNASTTPVDKSSSIDMRIHAELLPCAGPFA